MISRLRVVLTQRRFGNLSNGLKRVKNEMNKLKQNHYHMFANWVTNVEFRWMIEFIRIWTSISSGYFCSCWITDMILTIWRCNVGMRCKWKNNDGSLLEIGEWWKIEARIEFQGEFWCSTDLRLIFSRSWHQGCAFSHPLKDSSDCCRELDSCSGVCLIHIPMPFSWFWILFLFFYTLLALSNIHKSKGLCNQQFKTATESQCFCIQFTQKVFH
jgi:hypothetical protein